MDIRRYTRRTVHLAVVGGLGAALLTGPRPVGATSADNPAAASRTPATAADSDLVALRRIWERQAEAWARGDGAAYARIYTADADLVNIKGEHLRNRPVIAARLQFYFNNDLKNTHILRLDERVRLVSPTMAIIVRKDCVLYGAERSCRPDTLSINTSVAVKDAGQWLITSFHNTLVQPHDQTRRPFRGVLPATRERPPALPDGPGEAVSPPTP
ncbi:SgcJ/EcaC family oxidoreductase [Sphaerisporangium album]|uniref:SgcJ/EcaC family oxidoreductase n=1 Tax=Sphaerisporangium album TaxID=509200 RepID=A0A367FC78_9ACTN|nr:SgcJ/EcaC family oxidoreductase [Sphaerisporangium album]RCG27297.1 SgcJ/EcaC family oxidoreductase [Sphaerisporangium album]